MKKYLFSFLLVLSMFLVGCGKDSSKNIKDNLISKINDLNSYSIKGKLEVVNNDDVFNYLVDVNYKDKDFYRVSLKNVSNNHEQIILRNDDGVYVVTPSLNKSFKFQSDWPYNNSSAYILKNISNDLKNDDQVEIVEISDGYTLTGKVNFPNNPLLEKQRITVDKDLNVKKVEILNKDGISLMTFTIENANYKPSFNEGYFEINSIINDTEKEENKGNKNSTTASTIDDIIYPLYIPTGTVLTGEEKVSKTEGERIILTFGGEKPFTLVEETTNKEQEFTVVPTYGEPYLLIDTVAALSNNSINWVSNGIEYYIVSDVLNQNELIEVAKSVNVISVLK